MNFVKPFALATLAVITMCGCAEKTANPVAQNWPFEMQKVWEIKTVGGNELLRPAEPRVADDGTLFFRDFERNLSYIIDSEGKLVGSFAPQGEDEGEVSFYINCFPAGDYVAVCAPDKIHFFTKQGDFLKAVPNNLFVRFPLAFRNENEFWVAPGALGDTPGDSAEVIFVNLANDSESMVQTFARSELEKKPSGGAVVLGLTPQLKMGYDRAFDQIVFGKNSDTIIYRATADGRNAGSFAFSGNLRPVSEADKRDHFAQFDIPDEYLATLLDALPDRMANYNRIQAINGLIYLFNSEHLSGPHSGQTIDIYAPDGRHLYTGRIQLEPGWHTAGSADNLQLTDGFLYVVEENDAGEKKIVQYHVALPSA